MQQLQKYGSSLMNSRLLSTAHVLEHKDLVVTYHLGGCALLVGASKTSPIAVESEWESNGK